MEPLLELMKTVCAAYGVHTAFYDPLSGEALRRFDGGLRARLYENWEPTGLMLLLRSLEPGELKVCGDQFGCRYCFFIPPGGGANRAAIGPWQEERAGREGIDALMKRRSIPGHFCPELTAYLDSVPLIAAPHAWESMLSAFGASLFNGSGMPPVLTCRDYGGRGGDEKLRYSPEREAALSLEIIESRYEDENAMLKAVSEGDTEGALRCLGKLRKYPWRRMADKGRDMKNYVIILNTLARKAAENGFVHPAHLDRVSAGFARRVEEASMTSDLLHIGETMLRRYCALVREFSLRGFSPLVRNVINYIDFHLEGELSLSFLAGHFNVSAGYLSARFKKERNLTLTTYVINKRLELAAALLRGQGAFVQEAAERAGFLDVNYFCRLFKRRYGQSPGAFQHGAAGGVVRAVPPGRR
ncbi:MAG: AraC family transcriptional regulator [Spirochaetaceae bacterium]|jgi:AraC-like DNA-binding protein|nr:AraC family transcriptional regulator [Spirochaetaceae bacterium]